jgi:hypothetical protein
MLTYAGWIYTLKSLTEDLAQTSVKELAALQGTQFFFFAKELHATQFFFSSVKELAAPRYSFFFLCQFFLICKKELAGLQASKKEQTSNAIK